MNPEKGPQREGLVERLLVPWERMGDSAAKKINMILKQRKEAAQAITTLEAERDEEERAHGKTIFERDTAEDALSQAYFLIIGRSPEWSSAFGQANAIEEIDEAQHLLRAALQASEARVKELEEVLGPFAVNMHESHTDDGAPFQVYFSVGAIRRAQAALTSGGEVLTVSQSRPGYDGERAASVGSTEVGRGEP